MDDYEVVAEELSQLAEKMRGLEERLAEVEKVNAQLEEAALTTARAMAEVSRHWDAVYDAMRRADRIDRQISSERDNDAARTRRTEPSDATSTEAASVDEWEDEGDGTSHTHPS